MSSIDNIGEQKKDIMDDSGMVFDMSAQDVTMSTRVYMLDLSDDVLLYILRLCTPRDLKALGYSCSRLGSLVRERSLWRHVDARSERCSRARLKWLLEHALHADTHALMLTGYARDADGCMGLINVTRKEAENEISAYRRKESSANGCTTVCDAIHEIPIPINIDRMERHPARFFISAQRTPLPRHRCFPSWPSDGEEGRAGPQRCSGPQFTLSRPLLQQLAAKCPQLTTLALEYCNIDCSTTCLGTFPKTLKKLSLRGTKCYNMKFDKSFLFKIQDYLPILESLDVSECEWMDPATLLPLSKLSALQELIMQDCYKLAEFVAYASLTARYGFKALKSLDLRGSPVGDSEVSALGWLPQLEKLWLSARRTERARPHAHYADDVRAPHAQLHDWEACDSDETAEKPEDTKEDDKGANAASTSTGSRNDKPGCSGERPQTKPANDNKDGTDKKDNKRKSDKPTDDDSDGNDPPYKRRRTGVKISFENNTVTKKILPVIRNENGFFVFDETEENNQNNNDNNANRNPDNANDNGNVNRVNVPDGGMVPPNFEFNLINPMGSIDVGNVEIDFSVVDVDDLRDNMQNRDNNRDNPDNRNNQEYRYRYKSNDNREENANPNENVRVRDGPECIVDCIKIDQLIDVSDNSGGRQNEVIVIASSARPKSEPSTSKDKKDKDVGNTENKPEDKEENKQNSKPVTKNENPNSTDEKKDDKPKTDDPKPGPSKVNEGASTSKESKQPENGDKEKYVLFRKNKDPVYINCERPENMQRREPLPVQYQIEPRHHVLYVGVGPQLNTYRFPRDSSDLLRHLNYRPSHVDSSGLVTDFSVRRFGRADGEDINIIHIGPEGPMLVGQAPGSRPDRSSLRFLSVTGYRHVTDRSLLHLATAAPDLEFIDFSGTSVTDNGVENFRSLRPECDVVYSEYHNDENDKNDDKN